MENKNINIHLLHPQQKPRERQTGIGNRKEAACFPSLPSSHRSFEQLDHERMENPFSAAISRPPFFVLHDFINTPPCVITFISPSCPPEERVVAKNNIRSACAPTAMISEVFVFNGAVRFTGRARVISRGQQEEGTDEAKTRNPA